MAVSTQNGVTTLTPTAWKWFIGAAAAFLFFPGLGFFIAVVFVLMGVGVLQRLTLSKDGLKVRNWWSEKSYRWSEIGDFRTRTIKSGLINAANMVSFTHVDKDGTAMGKAAKFLAGGTHSVPAVGMPAKKLAMLMQAYKGGYVPADSAVEAPQAPIPVPVTARSAESATTPRAVPATPRAARTKVQTQRPAKPAATPNRTKSTPLVQDGGGLFGRRRPSSPFNS